MIDAFTIDDHPVAMDERDNPWEARTVPAGGFDSFAGTFPSAQASVGPDSIVRAFRTDSSVAYEGKVIESNDRYGLTTIDAQGAASDLEDYTHRLLYRLDGTAELTDGRDHGYPGNEKISLDPRAQRASFSMEKDDSLANGSRARLLLWTEGCDISRVAYGLDLPNGTLANWSHDLSIGDGPAGTMTILSSRNLSALPAPIDATVNASVDQLGLDLRATAVIAATTARKLVVSDMSTWGRISDDDISVSDIAIDVAGLMGHDPSGITTGGGGIMPLFWREGNAADLMDYLTALYNWRWLVLDDQGLGPRWDVGPWAKVWEGSFERGIAIDPSLRQIAPFNAVRVNFTSTSGESRSVLERPDVDPLNGLGDNPYVIDVQDPQANDALVREIAQLALPQVTRYHMAGTVRADEIFDGAGFRAGDHALAGDLLDITDMEPNYGPERIMGTTLRPTGAWLDVEFDLDLPFLTRRARHVVRRRRRRRHHRRLAVSGHKAA